MKDLERSRKRCLAEIIVDYDKDGNPVARPCNAPLWQYAEGQAIWAPADYIHKHMKGVFDYLICDEIHEEKVGIFRTGQRLGSPGGLVPQGGRHDRHPDRRQGKPRPLPVVPVVPNKPQGREPVWQDDMEFARRYGRVDTIVTEKTGQACDNRRSNGKNTTKRQAEQPGIMPTLYGRHLIGNTIFLSLKDVAADCRLTTSIRPRFA